MDANTLSARVIKAVYFPNTEFLNAEVGTSPSKVWRSIIEGRDVLNQGLVRRIGTGEMTNIWSTNWLPRDDMLRPARCHLANSPQLVSELIDETSATWNRQKLEEFFTPMDREVIENIPICMRHQEDFWAWHYEKKGTFSVRSAYRMLAMSRERATSYWDSTAGRSDTRAVEKEWNDIWRVKVPSKIRVFLWRLAKHTLPSGDRHHRQMAPHSLCTLCGSTDSWKHSLIECHMARSVWALEKEETTDAIKSGRQKLARGGDKYYTKG